MSEEFVKELVEMNREATAAHSRFLQLKEQSNDAKKAWEAKVTAIQEAISGYGKDYPLFDHKDDDDSGDDDSGDGCDGVGGGGPSGPVSPPTGGDGEPIDVEFTEAQPALPAPKFIQAVPAALTSEAWREVTIASLVDRYGLAEKAAELLDEAAIRTIGALADWNRERNRLTDIPGIGEARAAEIEEILEQFWGDWAKRDVADEVVAEKPSRNRKKSA